VSTIQRSIDVDVPVRTAYNQWTQLETFPHFVDYLHRLIQRTDTLLHGDIEFAGRHHMFEVDLVDQQPDEWIAWQAAQGTPHSGRATFQPLDEDHSRVVVELTVPDTVADMAAQLTEQGLAGFKRYIEDRGRESGAWRGYIASTSTDSGTVLPHVSHGRRPVTGP
jgi:uncharacterized membrane protein